MAFAISPSDANRGFCRRPFRRGTLGAQRHGCEGRSADASKTIRLAPKDAPCSRRSSPISKRASLPEPSQEDAWRTFADAMRASAGRRWTALAPRNLPALSRLMRANAETDGKACGGHAGDVWRDGGRLCGDRAQSDDGATRHPLAEHRSAAASSFPAARGPGGAARRRRRA